MKITVCNICGNHFGMGDHFHMSHRYGYGSTNDGDLLELDLCNTCLDKLTMHLVKECKISPLNDD